MTTKLELLHKKIYKNNTSKIILNTYHPPSFYEKKTLCHLLFLLNSLVRTKVYIIQFVLDANVLIKKYDTRQHLRIT